MPNISEKKIAPLAARPPARLGEDVCGSSFAFDTGRKRFQGLEDPPEAMLVLNAGGEIACMTQAARQLLRYRPEQPMAPSFFAHVHAKDLYRVLRDVAEMTCHGLREAAWQVRLRTGQGGWHWVRATVGNQLDQPERSICIYLHKLPA